MLLSETSEVRETRAKADVRKARDGVSMTSAPRTSGGAVYGLGMIGALVYFVGTAESRTDYVLALGKAIVWPALLVYRAFRSLGD